MIFIWKQGGFFFATSHCKSACDGIGGIVKRLVTKASLKRPVHKQILTPMDMSSYCESDVTGIKFFYVSSTTIKENVILLQDRYNAAQTVKGTRQLHRFVPQPLGKLLVYNTSLQASPPTECIIAKSISLSRVQIEDSTLQIGSFVACTNYDEKWWLGMVAQVSDEFGDHNINCMHLSGPGIQFHLPTRVGPCW